jgi:predicted esterase
VTIDGAPVGELSVPSYDKQRIAAADDLDMKVRGYVFSGETLPGCGFENPERAENLLGDVAIKRRYFDANFNEVTKATSPGRYGMVISVDGAGMETMYRYVTLFRTKEPFDDATWRPKVHVPVPPEFGLPEASADSSEVSALVRGSWKDGLWDKEIAAPTLAGLAEAQADGKADESIWVRNARWWHTLREKIGQPLKYPYLTWMPKGAAETTEKKFPAILFLHGSGERGRDLSSVEGAGPRGFAKTHPDFPFIVISPLCPNGDWWNAIYLDDLVAEVMAKYPIDPDRLYITGLSMGGFGTWDQIQLHPDRYAAAASLCAGGDTERVGALGDLPIWIFHGGKDANVSPVYAFQYVEGLRKINGRVRFTFYPELGHNIWTTTYSNERLYQWMLEQKRGDPKEPKSQAPGTQPTEVK